MNEFFETITDNFLYQHVTEYTRIRGPERSILDLIFTKEEDYVKNIKVLPPIGESDHGVVIGDFICEWKSQMVPKKRRVYFRGAYEEYEKSLNNKDWERDFSGNSVARNWDLYRSAETTLTNTHVPLIMPKDYKEPWMNRRVMKQWKRKQRAWR